jgi:hypothetical protein
MDAFLHGVILYHDIMQQTAPAKDHNRASIHAMNCVMADQKLQHSLPKSSGAAVN